MGETRGGSVYIEKYPQDVEEGRAVRIIGRSGDVVGRGAFLEVDKNGVFIEPVGGGRTAWPLSAFEEGVFVLQEKVPLTDDFLFTAERAELLTLSDRLEDGQQVEGATTGITESDTVNHPLHYNQDPSGVECIQIVRHRNYNVGNAIKYLWRAGLKDEDTKIEDLEKAAWSIRDEIDRLKGEV